MARFDRRLGNAVAIAAIIGLAACSGAAEKTVVTAAGEADTCVSLAEGNYYWDGKNFVAAAAPEAQVVEKVVQAPMSWPAKLEKTFPELGFPWMGLRVRDKVATLTGLAPDVSAKERAFTAGEAAIKAHPEGGSSMLVVDGIAVEGGEAGVGESLATLADSNLSLKDCQSAFNETMQGRNVNFQTNKALISPTSARLLDAVTGVAILCKSYSVEIGGHTDSRGSDEYNQALSQKRADEVRLYLIQKGVAADFLKSIGYGESKPLDPNENYDAWAKNRRTEFKVTER